MGNNTKEIFSLKSEDLLSTTPFEALMLHLMPKEDTNRINFTNAVCSKFCSVEKSEIGFKTPQFVFGLNQFKNVAEMINEYEFYCIAVKRVR